MQKKKKKLFLIISGIIVLILLIGGAFLAGKKFSEKKEANQVKTEQKTELEKQLQQLKSQLQKETNPANKQELENKINETNQQIKNLGGSTTPPTPNQNPPPKNPFKTSRQLTVKCNGASGGKCEYINIANSQERVLIDTKNKIFYSDDALYIKGNQYVITFNEEDAQKKGNNFIFDENNNKIKLTLATPIPKPVPSQIEIEVKWGGGSGRKNYWLLLSADWPKTKKWFFISKKNPAVKGKKFDRQITPKLKLTFEDKNASQKLADNQWLFNENNDKFTLIPLGNWPDDPNYEIEKETPKTIKELAIGGSTADYLFFNNIFKKPFISEMEEIAIHKDHPEIKRLNSVLKEEYLRYGQDKKIWIISFQEADEYKNGVIYINQENDSLEIKEKK